MEIIWRRVVRVLSLETDVFAQIEHDPDATRQAAIVVLVASVLAAVGGAIGATSFAVGLIGVLVWALIGWFLWAAVTYLIGVKLFGGEATMGEMLRVIGYAYAPRAFSVLSFLPLIGFAIRLLVEFWAIATVLAAIREGLDLSFWRTLVTVFIGWFLYLIGLGIVLAIAGSI